jgi:hypothetical protein
VLPQILLDWVAEAVLIELIKDTEYTKCLKLLKLKSARKLSHGKQCTAYHTCSTAHKVSVMASSIAVVGMQGKVSLPVSATAAALNTYTW